MAEALRRCGKYELIEELARGGSGVVYKARDSELDRVVALKMLDPQRMADPHQAERFAREVRLTAMLDHEGIVKIFDAGVHDQQPFFTMPLVTGDPLDQVIRERGLPIRRAAELVARCARTLAYAHAQGVIHRDIKPANILIRADGSPVLADFGIAKHLTLSTRLTETGDALGTPQYMPPEQIRGDMARCDTRSDIYSLGAVLYEALTGAPPFEGATYMEVSAKILNDELVPPGRKNPQGHRDLDAICMKAMHAEPGRRYQSAAEMADELERYLRGEAIQTYPERPFARGLRRAWRRHRLAVAVTLVMLVLAGWMIVLSAREDAQFDRFIAEGDRQQQEGRLKEALSAYNQALKLDPGNGVALRGKSDIYVLNGLDALQKGNLDAARNFLGGALALWNYRTGLVKKLEQAIADEDARLKKEDPR